jgi:hypothetical protein
MINNDINKVIDLLLELGIKIDLSQFKNGSSKLDLLINKLLEKNIILYSSLDEIRHIFNTLMTSNNKRELFFAKSDFCSLITDNSHRKLKQANLKLEDQKQKIINLFPVYLMSDID